jgi:ABC-type uncharacterized transport system YnjBCD ATPase subunit
MEIAHPCPAVATAVPPPFVPLPPAGLGSLSLFGCASPQVPAAALSGGQRSRVALAAVSYKKPHILILDEVQRQALGKQRLDYFSSI